MNTTLTRLTHKAPDASVFREAMSRVACSVHVITTVGPHGDAGITATAVCSVTDTPPTLLVCLNRNSYAHSVVSRSRSLAVNTLAGSQPSLADEFAGRGSRAMADRFGHASWTPGATGSPLLAGALVSFDCTVEHSIAVGSHDIFVCNVVDIVRSTSPQGLGYVGRRYFGVELGNRDPVRASPDASTGSQPGGLPPGVDIGER